jgi:alpha-tubulin suppressor-like RCC1 family protein
VKVLALPPIDRIAAGRSTTCAVTQEKDGRHVYCWGANNNRALGADVGGNAGPTEVTLAGTSPTQWLDDVRDLTVGGNFAVARRGDGTLHQWGDNPDTTEGPFGAVLLKAY